MLSSRSSPRACSRRRSASDEKSADGCGWLFFFSPSALDGQSLHAARSIIDGHLHHRGDEPQSAARLRRAAFSSGMSRSLGSALMPCPFHSGFSVHVTPGTVLAMTAKPVWCGILVGAGRGGSLRLVDRPAVLQGARRVLRDRVDQLRRGRAPGCAQLGRTHAGTVGA